MYADLTHFADDVDLSWISLADFRSYPELRWSPDPGINILVGNNGAGKTNLLEGVAYLASLRSLRGAPDEALVAESAPPEWSGARSPKARGPP